MTSPPKAIVHVRHVRRHAPKRVAIGAIIGAAWIAIVLFVLRGQGFMLYGPAIGHPVCS
jgi:hypothetical protein